MKIIFSLFFIFLSPFIIPYANARQECNQPLPDILDKVSPSVVFISSVEIDPYRYNDQVTSIIGSGFFIDKKGIILTNSHLVYGRRLINVTLDDGSLIEAELIGAEPILDLALLRIPTPVKALHPATLGDSQNIRVGEDSVTLEE